MLHSYSASYFWLCTAAERYKKKKLLFVHSHCFWLFYSFLFFLLFLFLFFNVNTAIVCAFKLLLLSFFLFLYSVHTSHCYIMFVRSYCYCSFIFFFFSFLILYIFTYARCFVKWVGTLLLHFIAYKTENWKSSFFNVGPHVKPKRLQGQPLAWGENCRHNKRNLPFIVGTQPQVWPRVPPCVGISTN